MRFEVDSNGVVDRAKLPLYSSYSVDRFHLNQVSNEHPIARSDRCVSRETADRRYRPTDNVHFAGSIRRHWGDGMKVLCDRDGLFTAFSMIDGVAPARSPKPVLQNVKFIADPDLGTVLMATDLELGIRHRVIGVGIDEPGAVILPGVPVRSILRTIKEHELSLATEGDHIVVRGVHSEFKLTSIDPNEFPEVPDFAATSYHVVAAANLKRIIRRTIFATDTESTRYALGGVLIELQPESIAMVGTDGRRLAYAMTVAEGENNPPTPTGTPVVPVKSLKLIDRNLNDDDPPVHIAIQGTTAILVRTENSVIYSRLVEGRFPQYRDVFPKGAEIRIPLEVGVLKNTVEQASVATNDDSRGVDFDFDEGMLRLSSQAADIGSSHVELPIQYSGPRLTIRFDPKYLLEALKALDDSSTIHAELIDPKSPAVFKTDDLYQYVVMPLARDN